MNEPHIDGCFGARFEAMVSAPAPAPAQPDDAELLWRLHQKLERLGWDTDEEGLATLAALDRAWRRA